MADERPAARDAVKDARAANNVQDALAEVEALLAPGWSDEKGNAVKDSIRPAVAKLRTAIEAG